MWWRHSKYGWCLRKIIHILELSLVSIEPRQGGVFLCEVTADGRNVKCRYAFRLRLRSCLKNLGIPVWPLPPHLPFQSLVSAVVTCTKNGQPCRRSSIELHKKGKELEPKHFKNHESEKNDNRRGQAGRDRPLPELPQDRQCPRYEKALLWRRVPISAVLWVAD